MAAGKNAHGTNVVKVVAKIAFQGNVMVPCLDFSIHFDKHRVPDAEFQEFRNSRSKSSGSGQDKDYVVAWEFKVVEWLSPPVFAPWNNEPFFCFIVFSVISSWSWSMVHVGFVLNAECLEL